MAVGGALLKIGPFKTSKSGKPFGCLGLAFPHLDYLYMEGTSSTADVEPKKKSQDPAAKAKRLKRLLANPDFAEAVEFERSLVKKYKQCVAESAEHLIEAFNATAAIQKQIEGKMEFYKEYTEQLKENKELNKVIEAQNSTIKLQDEVIGYPGTTTGRSTH
jgi:hypothetical protein